MVQVSHQYMTAGKTTALTIWTFVGKVISLIFNTLSRFIIEVGLIHILNLTNHELEVWWLIILTRAEHRGYHAIH